MNVYVAFWMHSHMLGKHIFSMCYLHREFRPSQEWFRYVRLARNSELWSQTFPENANAFDGGFWEGLSGLEGQKLERLILEMLAAHSLVIKTVCWDLENLHSLMLTKIWVTASQNFMALPLSWRLRLCLLIELFHHESQGPAYTED